MPGLTDAFENAYIDFRWRAQTWTLNANATFELYTAAPGETGGGTVAAYTGYAAVSVARSLANFAGTQSAGSTTASTGTSGQTSNNAAITFGAPTSGPSTITHLGVKDGTTLAEFGALTTSRTLNNGDAAPSFAAAAFTSTID